VIVSLHIHATVNFSSFPYFQIVVDSFTYRV
jgi:hypothetical protein